jgi:hypothetical protein
MTLQLLHSEFPYIWWKFDFFLSVQLKIIVEKGFYGKVRTIREKEGGEGVLRQKVASHNVYVTKRSITQRSINTYVLENLTF